MLKKTVSLKPAYFYFCAYEGLQALISVLAICVVVRVHLLTPATLGLDSRVGAAFIWPQKTLRRALNKEATYLLHYQPAFR